MPTNAVLLNRNRFSRVSTLRKRLIIFGIYKDDRDYDELINLVVLLCVSQPKPYELKTFFPQPTCTKWHRERSEIFAHSCCFRSLFSSGRAVVAIRNIAHRPKDRDQDRLRDDAAKSPANRTRHLGRRFGGAAND